MWSSFFLAPPRWPSHPLLFPNPTTAAVSATATANPHRHRAVSARQVGDLGHTLQSNPQRRRELGGKGAQINGSDVLWALQRASARKEMKMRKKKKQMRMEEEEEDLSSARRSTEESGVDDGDVREVCIKSEWGDRLDELEERLQELSRII